MEDKEYYVDYINRLYDYLKELDGDDFQWDYDELNGFEYDGVDLLIGAEKYCFVDYKRNWCLKVITCPSHNHKTEPFIYQEAVEAGLEQYFYQSTPIFTIDMPQIGECEAYLQRIVEWGENNDEFDFYSIAPGELVGFLDAYGLSDFHHENWTLNKDTVVKLFDYSC